MTLPTLRITDVVKQDHRDIESYYDRIIGSSEETEQTKYQNQFTWELARHSIGEELVIYPAFEEFVSGGVEIANKDRQEHQKVKVQLKAFQSMKPSNPQFIPTIKALMVELSQHITNEETNDLPKLEEALSRDESKNYAESFGRTKMFVPSRSHPTTPNKPPYETVVGLLAAPIDRLADLFRQWPDTRTMSYTSL
ncbi:hypothetical protein N7451_012292 [Penicillium sp. IBT 35674x]|nr:hypothetical protein N7451_012292 [Penicillium sp. IBT 35674x]